MKYQPTVIIDDFFEKPDEIRKYAESLEYHTDPKKLWPGSRSNKLHEVDIRLYDHICRKALNAYYDFRHIENSEIILEFQRISDNYNTGWIHRDNCIFTFMVYLSKDDHINSGTSFYNLKKDKLLPWTTLEQYKYEETLRAKTVIGETLTEQEKKYKREYEDYFFEKSLDIKDRFNRFICFDANKYHAANNYSNSTDKERFFLIGFVYGVKTFMQSPKERILSVP